MSLRGKTAIVTGGAGGLGRAIADMYLSRGANVAVCDNNSERIAAAQESLAAAGMAERSMAVCVDVTDDDMVRSFVDAVATQFGGLHLVVNNAGIMDRFDPAGSCDRALWDRVLAVNLTGPFLVTKHALPHMLRAKVPGDDEGNGEGVAGGAGGLFVNIASNASVRGLSAGVAYAASKHGLIALTKNTAGAYQAQGVHCVALRLGGMDETNLSDAFAEGLNNDGMCLMQDTMPGFRSVPVEHVTRYVGFLSEGDMGRSANGSCITLNSNWPEA